MAYKAVLRVEKIKTFGQLKAYLLHANRIKETPNANKNIRNIQLRGEENVVKIVDEFIKSRGIKITKGKNNQSVLCTEMVLTASKDFFRNKDGSINKELTAKWIKENNRWLTEKYGDNYLFAKVHLDETTPHISAIICATKYNKAYKREVLAHKAWFGKTIDKKKNININKLRDLQTEYAERMQECGFKLERGKEKSNAKHKDIKDFYADINKTKEKFLEEREKAAIEINARNIIVNKLADNYGIQEQVKKAYPKAREMAEKKLKDKKIKNNEELDL
ncbi:MobV family relaxase [Clostridium perfringens]|uniref:MobV family relaxase n=1 Tax=Clostridium perfringens TaxID=1502 RepID=UPI00375485E2